MSPARRSTGGRQTRFPRVSGDEPVHAEKNADGDMFSPRERG